jgi:hypothetical protein
LNVSSGRNNSRASRRISLLDKVTDAITRRFINIYQVPANRLLKCNKYSCCIIFNIIPEFIIISSKIDYDHVVIGMLFRSLTMVLNLRIGYSTLINQKGLWPSSEDVNRLKIMICNGLYLNEIFISLFIKTYCTN